MGIVAAAAALSTADSAQVAMTKKWDDPSEAANAVCFDLETLAAGVAMTEFAAAAAAAAAHQDAVGALGCVVVAMAGHALDAGWQVTAAAAACLWVAAASLWVAAVVSALKVTGLEQVARKHQDAVEVLHYQLLSCFHCSSPAAWQVPSSQTQVCQKVTQEGHRQWDLEDDPWLYSASV